MFKKNIFILLLCVSSLFSTVSYSMGCPTNKISVPFTNFTLNNKCSVFADYAFGNTNKILFCYDSAATSAGILYWQYYGNIFFGAMPIQLTVSSKYQGYLADSSGTLQVVNNTNSALIISCIFAF